ncbi:MAG: hypothetical protein KC506_02040 [Nanoarchaeota archaeon]|nr:hypothetical protein [Nanoarchaeota archaeon]
MKLVLLLLGIVFLVLPSVSAINVSIESRTVANDVEFGLDITLNSEFEIFAGQVDITFDPAVLQFVRMEKGDYFGSGSLDSSDLGGVVQGNGVIEDYIAMRNLGETDGISGEGVFARVIFRALDADVTNVSVNNVILGNSSAVAVVDPGMIITEGEVTVSESSVCGDGTCTEGETCSSCSLDCGACSSPPGNGGGGSGSGGGGGGSTSSNDDDGSIVDTFLGLFTGSSSDEESNECSENWQCDAWSVCINGERSRNCTDLNGCSEDMVDVSDCTESSGNIVVAGVISVTSFLGLIVFVFLYFRTRHVVAKKQKAVIEGAEKMRAQWK